MDEICQTIKKEIEKNNFKVTNIIDDEAKCLIDFKHPKVKETYDLPVAWWLSSVIFNKKEQNLDTTIRSKIDKDTKQLFLDYCCENGEMVCHPHFHIPEGIVSVEAKFWENPLEKFKRLLDEMRNG